ncbi:MAG: hypothetical protein R3302_01695 [Sulfurimonadaceae bacterium]|nr:hypothetical protein [Sulfurimonadaceae bacterium]
MKQINPLYIALLLIAALMFVTVKLYQANEINKEAAASLQQTETMAKRIVTLKKEWDNGKKSYASLQRLLKTPMLRNAGVTGNKKSDSIQISAKQLDKKSLDYLMNKLLNGTYTVKALKIKRIDATTASFYAEVAL